MVVTLGDDQKIRIKLHILENKEVSMGKFDTEVEDKELFELIDQINKAYKKKISRLLQFLKRNDSCNRETVRKLTRQAREKNDDLFSKLHSLYRFLQQIELQITKKEDVNMIKSFVMNEEILAGRANMIIIKE